MADIDYKIEDLIKNSMEITFGMMAVFPKTMEEKRIKISSIVYNFPNCYSVKSEMVAFVYRNKFFVTPYLTRVIKTLNAYKLKKSDFYVPFSSGELPKGKESKWQIIINEANRNRIKDFKDSCMEYCLLNNINKLSKGTLRKCLKIPERGVQIKFLYNSYSGVMPIVRSKYFNSDVAEKLGTYSFEWGYVVFVYVDGDTYVSKDLAIVAKLNEAGFEKRKYIVPFVRGEEILDENFKEKWDAL